MDREEVDKLLKISRDINDALSTTIKIGHEQVTEIVVADLFGKYKHAIDRGLSSEAEMLKCVLMKYYLDEGELTDLLNT